MKEQHKALLLKTAQILRQQQKQMNWLVNEHAQHLHNENASKLARDLAQRGIYTPEEMEEKAREIAKLGNLGAIHKAVELISPKRDLPIGTVEKVAVARGQDKLLDDPAIQFLMEHIC